VFPRESDMAIAWREALANSIIHGSHENPGLSCMRLVLRIPSRVYLPFLPLSSS
jgi:anti-sigma regulatory factor (Ser/Thr protein kinase)